MSAGTEAPKEMITLRSSDGQEFQVEKAVAIQSITIKSITEDGGGDCCLPLTLSVIRGETMKEIIVYWKRHAPRGESLSEEEQNKLEDDLKKFDDEFVKSKDRDELFEIIAAANFLNSESLLDLIAWEIANRASDMSAEEVREYFGLENDLSPEEEQNIRDENPWIFE